MSPLLLLMLVLVLLVLPSLLPAAVLIVFLNPAVFTSLPAAAAAEVYHFPC
jgi:hypothetical protein